MLPTRAYVFIGLNAVRTLSIIALLLVFSSSVFVMVNDIKAVNAFIAAGAGRSSGNSTDIATTMLDCDYIEGSTVPNQPAGVFWAVLNRLLIIFQIIALLFSEIGWPAVFFDRFFPVLGKDFGVGALGVFQCLLGAAILSHHCDDFSLVSAFFLFALGCLNILVGLIWRESAKSKRSFTSWREQKKSVLPTAAPSQFVTSVFDGVRYDRDSSSEGSLASKSGYGFGRQGEKAAGLKGFLISKPVESLPRYAPKTNPDPRSHSPTFQSSPTAI